jgi:hypothetical protein
MNPQTKGILSIVFALVLVVLVVVIVIRKQQPDTVTQTPTATTTKAYNNDSFGFSFQYPEGYLVQEKENDNGMRYSYTVTLLEDNASNRALIEGRPDAPQEGPTAIIITAYENNLDKYSLYGWLIGTNDSNFKLSNGTYASTTVAGKEALAYQWSGLYEADAIVVAHEDNLFSLTATYITPDDPIRTDFETVLNTLSFKDPVR